MATRSSILAWRIPWTKEPGGPQSGESQESNAAKQLRTHTNRYRYMDIYLNVCVNIIHIFEYMYEQNRGFPGGSDGRPSAYSTGNLGSFPGSGRSPGEGNGNPPQYSCLENPRDRGTWWAAVCGVSQSRTRLT